MGADRWARGWPAATLLVAFCGWTALLGAGAWRQLDAWGVFAPPDLASPAGQIAAAIALLTWPGLQYLILIPLAVWAWRRRLRHLSVTAIVSGVVSWTLNLVVKVLVDRPRPATALDLITTAGHSYPSSHLTATSTIVTIAMLTAAATRQPRRVRRWVALAGTLLLLIVGFNRILLQAHYISDVVGGVLLGATVATGIATISGLRPEFLPRRRAAPRGRCAVIVNPAKVEDWATLRRNVSYEADVAGWRVLWLETTSDEAAAEQVADARRANVSLIIAAGGDGTIREVSSALVGSDIRFAILPLGTGNLLARNLGIPLDVQDAVKVAFGPNTRAIDLVRLTADDREPEHFAVMAGMGVDAALMNATNADLKRILGPAAYFLAAPFVLTAPPFSCRISVDEGEELPTMASIALVGNVGTVMGQIQLLPDAKPDDGILDLLVASPQKVTDWARIAGRVMSGANDPAEIARASGTAVSIEIDGDPVEYQLDGDTVGSCTRLIAEVVPEAISVKVP